MRGVFVTGTDTGCGKTEISLGLMAALQARGFKVQGMKPVASGCESSLGRLCNEDAMRLRAQSTWEAPYELVNPYAFEPPIAPHIAAGRSGVDIELGTIRSSADALAAEADLLVIEGIGGWRVPLGPTSFVSDLPKALGLPVIMVSGLKLGCLNHTLLTVESIRAGRNRIAGWVANQIDPQMRERDENLATLAALIDAPFLGLVPWMVTPDPQRIARYLNVESLL